MIRFRGPGAFGALLAAVSLAAVLPVSASAAPAAAPAATLSGTCGGGVCVVMSRAETKTISNGGPAKAIGVISPACLLIPMPLFSGICLAGAAAAGPGVSLIADLAVAQDKCSAFGVDPINKRVTPAVAPCVE